MTGRRRRWAAITAAVTLLVAGCAADRPSTERVAAPPHLAGTQNYLPGIAADVYLPQSPAGRTPVVVLIPGGGWRTADRGGLGALAATLAGHGMVAVNATYRAADSGVRFPVPVNDVVCAIDFAADRARRAGIVPGPLVVLGHSAGAHLAALAALAGDRFRKDCPYPPAQVDGFVGLSGPYNIVLLSDAAYPLFGAGPAADPTAWNEGNPMTWLAQRTAHPLRALLVHGAADDLVAPSFSRTFAASLEAAGHPVELRIIAGARHNDTFKADVVAATVIAWIAALPSDQG